MRDQRRPLREHLEELRRRLLRSLIALAVCTLVTFTFWKQLLRLLLAPAQGLASAPTGKPIFTEATEVISITFKVSLIGGLILALPFVLYQAVMFVAPGLTPKERRYLFTLLPFSIISFASGVAFGYYVLLPPAFRFLLTFGSDVVTPMVRVGNLVNLEITLLFWIGLAFETPLVMFLLAKVGVVNARSLARARRYVLVGAFVLGGVITPTFDPINQTLVAVPLYLLYELGVLLARVARRGEVRRPAPAKQAGL